MNIYVGNLSFKVDENELRDAFEEYGSVSSVKIITDKFTGRSKGFAFVEMDNDSDAENAIEGLNGKSIDNRNISVSVAREKRENNRRY
ncbi:MAG: RNA-binding protein [Bacteroidetes bacterium]|nr:RNA-binding protein [Bacteroidota bacterium]